MKKRVLVFLCAGMILSGCSSFNLDSIDNYDKENDEAIEDSYNKNTSSGNDSNSQNATSSNNDSSEVSKVADVSWNNDQTDFDGSVATTVTFLFTDKTEKIIDTKLSFRVEKSSMLDIDNDGEDEYLIYGNFNNTAGEYSLIYVYKVEGNNVTTLYSPSEFEMFPDDVVNTTLTTTTVTGKTINAFDIYTLEKNGGEVREQNNSTIYYENGQWNKVEK